MIASGAVAKSVVKAQNWQVSCLHPRRNALCPAGPQAAEGLLGLVRGITLLVFVIIQLQHPLKPYPSHNTVPC